MSETLLSVGIDIGTSTTQLIFSRLYLRNRANAFSVPDVGIEKKEILYRSGIHFTPLTSSDRIDAPAVRRIVDAEYRAAGMTKDQIQTGAVIITGETARKGNAESAVKELSGYAGDFVVATAGPDLESELAARGAGAEQWAKTHGSSLIHIDIGGGTSNFAVFSRGQLLDTGCLNVGGRLLRLAPDGTVLWCSPALSRLCKLKAGDNASEAVLNELVCTLTHALEEAAGKRPPTELSALLATNRLPKLPMDTPAISFSGGVGALLEDAEKLPSLAYGDIGVLLARRIRHSRLTQGEYRVCPDAIRATVIGAGCHATTMSGSTVYYQNIRFPLRQLPAACLTAGQSAMEPEALADAIKRQREKVGGSPAAITFSLSDVPDFDSICRLADGIAMAADDAPVITVTHADCAKALGQALACRMGKARSILCLDALELRPGSYLDIGCPVSGGDALPVIIKTLIFSN